MCGVQERTQRPARVADRNGMAAFEGAICVATSRRRSERGSIERRSEQACAGHAVLQHTRLRAIG